MSRSLKMLKTRIIFVLSSLVLFVSQVLWAAPTIQNLNLSNAETQFEKDILNSAGAVVTLAKPLRLYHYFNAATQANQLWPTYQNIVDRYREGGQTQFDLIYKSSDFWDSTVHDTNLVNAGPGMYLAIEPLVSQKYGHSMYILDFPAGTKYIDFSDPQWKAISKIKISKNTLIALVQEGILTQNQIVQLELKSGYFIRRAMQFIAAPENEKFRQMVSKIFARNKISLVQYTWERTALKLFCKSASSSAFVFIGAVNMDTSSRYASSVSMELVKNTIFSSQFRVQQQSSRELEVDVLTQKMRSALESGTKEDLSLPEIQSIKNVTFGCD